MKFNALEANSLPEKTGDFREITGPDFAQTGCLWDSAPGACRRLAAVMRELAWTALRVRGLTRGGYLEQVRGYCRNPSRAARKVWSAA
jgi:hypothetical protein